jgi:hypothetical protein
MGVWAEQVIRLVLRVGLAKWNDDSTQQRVIVELVMWTDAVASQP